MSTSDQLQEVVKRFLAQKEQTDNDYESYEAFFRGNKAIAGRKQEFKHLVKQIISFYKKNSSDMPANWLDIGCGRGHSLEVIRDMGVSACGIEHNPVLAGEAAKSGFPVIVSDAASALAALNDAGLGFDVISLLHILEHLNPPEVEMVIRLVDAALNPGGLVVVVVPEIGDERVLRESFYRDPTHQRPYPSRLLSYYMDKSGIATQFATAFDKKFSTTGRSSLVPKSHLQSLLNIRKLVSDI